MESPNTIQLRMEGPLAYILLNKPDKLNALDEQTLEAIERCFCLWESECRVKVTILGSTSARAFCVGADIDVLAGLNAEGMSRWERLGNRVLNRVQDSAILSIAMLPGHTLGGGMTLAAACDFRICSTEAAFAQPEIDLGWVPGWGGVARLARLIGPARAKHLCISGRRLRAKEALDFGLVDEAVAPEELETRVKELAASLCLKSGTALQAIKRLADGLQPARGATAIEFDALLNSSLLHDPAGQAAIEGFLARRSTKR